MYKFIVDAQLPPALARLLSSLGEEAIHVFDVDMMEASDNKIWVRMGNTSKKSLIQVFNKTWPQIKSELDKGETLIELQ